MANFLNMLTVNYFWYEYLYERNILRGKVYFINGNFKFEGEYFNYKRIGKGKE